MNKAEAKNLFELALVSDNPNVYKPAYKVLRTVIRDTKITKRDIVHWMNAINAKVVYAQSYKDSFGDRYYELALDIDDKKPVIIASSWSGVIYKLAYKLLGYKHNLTMSQLHDIEAWSYDSQPTYKAR